MYPAVLIVGISMKMHGFQKCTLINNLFKITMQKTWDKMGCLYYYAWLWYAFYAEI